MLAIKGIYENGKISLQEKVKISKPVNVIITFLEDVEKPLSGIIDLRKFSFNKSRELLKNYKGSLSDVVIEERRNAIWKHF